MWTSFSPLQVNGGFLLPWKSEFGPNLPQSLSPTPVMLHTKFDQDWPIGFGDIQDPYITISSHHWKR